MTAPALPTPVGKVWVRCWSCHGSGEGSSSCCDDLCQDIEPGEVCMHGDGNEDCDECNGEGGYYVPADSREAQDAD